MEGADIDGDDEFDYKKHVQMIANTVLQINEPTIKVRTNITKMNLYSRLVAIPRFFSECTKRNIYSWSNQHKTGTRLARHVGWAKFNNNHGRQYITHVCWLSTASTSQSCSWTAQWTTTYEK